MIHPKTETADNSVMYIMYSKSKKWHYITYYRQLHGVCVTQCVSCATNLDILF